MADIRCLCILLPLLAAGTAAASDEDFLKSLQGQWDGGGMVKDPVSAPTVNITCHFASEAKDAGLSMAGTCRGMLIFTRALGADLSVAGSRYSGVYIGPSGKRSSLSGSRSGNAINLAIRWSKLVNGDRNASLVVEKVGDNGMRLTTVDVDPSSGKPVVTSEINLKRK
ncbi:hypothetical protein [Rhizobium sp. RAF56]|uniref:hypothetical protein n=1 Tax=Rhizobium sp. RAF56 TaxID=3233062 RepID=UPI003F98BD2C